MSDTESNVVTMPGVVLTNGTAKRASHISFAEHFTTQFVGVMCHNGMLLVLKVQDVATPSSLDRIDSIDEPIRSDMLHALGTAKERADIMLNFCNRMRSWAVSPDPFFVPYLKDEANSIANMMGIDSPPIVLPEIQGLIDDCNAYLEEVRPLAQMMLSHREPR